MRSVYTVLTRLNQSQPDPLKQINETPSQNGKHKIRDKMQTNNFHRKKTPRKRRAHAWIFKPKENQIYFH